MMAAWGGTTTAYRDDWLDIIATGKKEGWFKVFYGNVEEHERARLARRHAASGQGELSGEPGARRGLHHRLHRADLEDR